MSERILFVEDEPDLGCLIKQYLETKGFDVEWHDNARDAFRSFKENLSGFGLCLLDVQMRQKSGFELAEHILKLNSNVPFIFLTARTDKKDRLHGLTIGAADYINKPFDIDELAIKLKNILRMTAGVSTPATPLSVYKIGDILFDREQLTITTSDNKVTKLTIREGELIEYFYKNKNKRLRKEDILICIWGENDYFLGRSLDVFISRLRKIIASSKAISLSNVYGAGYIFNVTELESN
ncbi:MAG: response regulator transcription factor [Chitinophagaceae bacterium]